MLLKNSMATRVRALHSLLQSPSSKHTAINTEAKRFHVAVFLLLHIHISCCSSCAPPPYLLRHRFHACLPVSPRVPTKSKRWQYQQQDDLSTYVKKECRNNFVWKSFFHCRTQEMKLIQEIPFSGFLFL